MCPGSQTLPLPPEKINLRQLAKVLLGLSPNQKEELDILLSPDAMKTLVASQKEIAKGDTIPLDEW